MTIGSPRSGCSAGKMPLSNQPVDAHRTDLEPGSGFRLCQPAGGFLQLGVEARDPRTVPVTLHALTGPGLAVGGADLFSVQRRRDRRVVEHLA